MDVEKVILLGTGAVILLVLAAGTRREKGTIRQSNAVREIVDQEKERILTGSDEECAETMEDKKAEVLRHKTGYVSKKIKTDCFELLRRREIRKNSHFNFTVRVKDGLEGETRECLIELRNNLKDILSDRSSKKYLKSSRDKLDIIYQKLDEGMIDPITFFRENPAALDEPTGLELYDFVIFDRVKNPVLLERTNNLIEKTSKTMMELSAAIHEMMEAKMSLERTIFIKEEFEAFAEFFLP